MESEAFDTQNRVQHVRTLVDAALVQGVGECYSARNMGNLRDFFEKIVRRDCLPPTRERLLNLLIEELNLSENNVNAYLNGLTPDKKNRLIRLIAETEVPLIGSTYSDRIMPGFVDPDATEDIISRGSLVCLLPWMFCKNATVRSGSFVSIASTPVPQESTSEGDFCFTITTKPPERLIHLQGLKLSVIDADGKNLGKKEIPPTGIVVFDLKDIEDREQLLVLNLVEEF